MWYTLGLLHLEEQLFIVVCYVKYAHYLLGVGDDVGESFRWKHVVLIEIEDTTKKEPWT